MEAIQLELKPVPGRSHQWMYVELGVSNGKARFTVEHQRWHAAAGGVVPLKKEHVQPEDFSAWWTAKLIVGWTVVS